MISGINQRHFAIIFILCMVVLFMANFIMGQEAVQAQDEIQQIEEHRGEKIKPGPKDSKELISVYVFLSWIWLSIIILIYILILKIKEVDRLFLYGFFKDYYKKKE